MHWPQIKEEHETRPAASGCSVELQNPHPGQAEDSLGQVFEQPDGILPALSQGPSNKDILYVAGLFLNTDVQETDKQPDPFPVLDLNKT